MIRVFILENIERQMTIKLIHIHIHLHMVHMIHMAVGRPQTYLMQIEFVPLLHFNALEQMEGLAALAR